MFPIDERSKDQLPIRARYPMAIRQSVPIQIAVKLIEEHLAISLDGPCRVGVTNGGDIGHTPVARRRVEPATSRELNATGSASAVEGRLHGHSQRSGLLGDTQRCNALTYSGAFSSDDGMRQVKREELNPNLRPSFAPQRGLYHDPRPSHPAG